eukprot:1943236-Prymnesium_polylepis.1
MIGAELVFALQKEVRKYEKSGALTLLQGATVTKLLQDGDGAVVGVAYVQDGGALRRASRPAPGVTPSSALELPPRQPRRVLPLVPPSAPVAAPGRHTAAAPRGEWSAARIACGGSGAARAPRSRHRAGDGRLCQRPEQLEPARAPPARPALLPHDQRRLGDGRRHEDGDGHRRR